MTGTRPRLGVFKFASCDGCQLSLLDCENELLALGSAIEIGEFLEASSRVLGGALDLALVEGSITTEHDRERIQRVRARSKVLVTIGACATAGGIQALRNFADAGELTRLVYAQPEYVDTLATSTPIASHVKVDFELRGCPVDKHQLLDVVTSFLAGRRPRIGAHSVCLDCKRRGNVCVMVVGKAPCLGPVTHAGCGALCPSYARGCYGCFGPSESSKPHALRLPLLAAGASERDVKRLYATFNAAAEPFTSEHQREKS